MQVEDLLQERGIKYLNAGGKDLKIHCLNPEHDDSDPSLRIDKITGVYHCFSCGFKGNIFNYFEVKGNQLVIAREKLKRKIVSKFRETVGVEIPQNAIPFRKDWRDIKSETYQKFEAFKHSDSEFVGRVVFPIRNLTGKIVAFLGRAESPDTSPRYRVFPSDTSLPFFPIVKPIQDRVLLVEGVFDMLNLHDKGLTNAICSFGTRTVSEEKLRLLKVQGITGVDIFYDNDEAGQKASAEVKEMAEKVGLIVNIISTKMASDPGELTAQQVLKLGEKLYGKNCFNRD